MSFSHYRFHQNVSPQHSVYIGPFDWGRFIADEPEAERLALARIHKNHLYTNSQSSLVKVIGALKEDDQLIFFNEIAANLNMMGFCYADLIKVMKKDADKIVVAIACKDRVSKEVEFRKAMQAAVIAALPENYRYDYAVSIINDDKDLFHVYEIVNAIPRPLRYQFYSENLRGKPLSSFDAQWIVQLTEAKHAPGLAIELKDLITDYDHLNNMVESIISHKVNNCGRRDPKTVSAETQKKLQDLLKDRAALITNGRHINMAVQLLRNLGVSQEDIKIFVFTDADHAINREFDLKEAMAALSLPHNLQAPYDLLVKKKDILTTIDQVADVLKIFPSLVDRWRIISYNFDLKSIIKTGHDVLVLLKTIPLENRANIANYYKDLLAPNPGILDAVIEILPKAVQENFRALFATEDVKTELKKTNTL